MLRSKSNPLIGDGSGRYHVGFKIGGYPANRGTQNRGSCTVGHRRSSCVPPDTTLLTSRAARKTPPAVLSGRTIEPGSAGGFPMIALRLVHLIENHSEELAEGLTQRLLSSERTSDLRKVPTHELHHRCHEIYRNLSDWLLNKTEHDIETAPPLSPAAGSSSPS